MTNSDWDIELFIRVTGRGRIGADGMVLFFKNFFCILTVLFCKGDLVHGRKR